MRVRMCVCVCVCVGGPLLKNTIRDAPLLQMTVVLIIIIARRSTVHIALLFWSRLRSARTHTRTPYPPHTGIDTNTHKHTHTHTHTHCHTKHCRYTTPSKEPRHARAHKVRTFNPNPYPSPSPNPNPNPNTKYVPLTSSSDIFFPFRPRSRLASFIGMIAPTPAPAPAPAPSLLKYRTGHRNRTRQHVN